MYVKGEMILCIAGVRESGRYLYDMDWFRKGQLPGFSFVPTANREDRHKEIVTTHHLLAQLMAVNKVMHGLREHIALTGWDTGERNEA